MVLTVLVLDVGLQMKFQLERETAIFMGALKGPDVEMAVEVSFSI